MTNLSHDQALNHLRPLVKNGTIKPVRIKFKSISGLIQSTTAWEVQPQPADQPAEKE